MRYAHPQPVRRRAHDQARQDHQEPHSPSHREQPDADGDNCQANPKCPLGPNHPGMLVLMASFCQVNLLVGSVSLLRLHRHAGGAHGGAAARLEPHEHALTPGLKATTCTAIRPRATI